MHRACCCCAYWSLNGLQGFVCDRLSVLRGIAYLQLSYSQWQEAYAVHLQDSKSYNNIKLLGKRSNAFLGLKILGNSYIRRAYDAPQTLRLHQVSAAEVVRFELLLIFGASIHNTITSFVLNAVGLYNLKNTPIKKNPLEKVSVFQQWKHEISQTSAFNKNVIIQTTH